MKGECGTKVQEDVVIAIHRIHTLVPPMEMYKTKEGFHQSPLSTTVIPVSVVNKGE